MKHNCICQLTGGIMKYQHVQATDPEIYALMADELHRQQSHLELIASENFVSEAVM